MTDEPKAIQFGVAPRHVAATMSGLEQLQAAMSGALPAPPISQQSDFLLAEVGKGRCVFEGMPSAKFYNPLGTVHGGWIATLLDSALGCSVHTMLEPGQTYTTTSITINFVRPVLDTTGKVRCEGVAIHTGSRLATSEARLVDGAGKLIAHGIGTCLIMAMPKPEA